MDNKVPAECLIGKTEVEGLDLSKAQVSDLNLSGRLVGAVVNLNKCSNIAGIGLKSAPSKFEAIVDNVYSTKLGDESNNISNDRKFQPIEFDNSSGLLAYYHDGSGHLYSIAKLVELTKDLVPFDVPIEAIDLSPQIWKDSNMYDLAYHVKLVNEADLSYPIILDWLGGIADGRHRLIKALVLGHTTIKCVRMKYKPEFDKVME